MDLERFPRRRYTDGLTPLHALPRLSETLGVDVHVKRDDLLGLTAGGNKTRKLEFLVGDALSRGADTLITCGAVQSNHCRLTAAAAVVEGLQCHLVLEERVPGSYRPDASGNNFLYRLLGVTGTTVVPGGTDMDEAMDTVRRRLEGQGRTCWIIPPGGSSPVGATGYAACAAEILVQLGARDLEIDLIVCASGSGGTHAGLLAGLQARAAGIPVLGIDVRRPRAEQEAWVHDLANRTAAHIGGPPVPRSDVTCRDEYVGPGYSLPTPAMVEAVQLLARKEAVLLDPVYTGKAMAGLIDLARAGRFRDQRVLFLHTGGAPALYAYRDTVLEEV